MSMNDRTKLLLKDEGLEKLKKAKVIVFGIGGVGGYVCEMLVRTGIENITIVDFDVVSESNLNRQIIALNSTLNISKVDAMQARLLDINPNLKLTKLNIKLTVENIEQFNLSNYDFVVDCIDMVKSKIALIYFCHKNNINIISSMGTGNKANIPNFKVCDLYQTKYDGLARVLRHELKKLGVTSHLVVCTDEQPVKADGLGSVVYYPAMCACVLSAYVIKQLTNKN